MPPVFSKPLCRPVLVGSHPARQGRTSPCELRCPAGNPVQRLHACVEAGRFDEALRWLHSRNPFPGITGRVCPHPCEDGCNRACHDEALSIRALERLAADKGGESALRPRPATGRRVGIVGAGPAGLACAWFAALLGHSVTVYERAPVAGGLPRLAVPDFRLPKDVVDRETAAVLSLGVRVHTNVHVGRDITLDALRARYDACVIAAGFWQERRLDCPGIEATQPAVRFLCDTALRRQSLAGLTVLILGGGGVALDCAFTAKRLGARSVTLLSLEEAEALRVPAEEIAQARTEEIDLLGGRLARAIHKSPEAGTTGLCVETARVASFSFAADGSLQALFQELPPERHHADLVLVASGLMPDLGFASLDGLERTARGGIAVNLWGETSLPGLFAAGDVALGPSTVAAAIGSGRRAALGLHCRLMHLETMPDLEVSDDGTLCEAPGRPGGDIAEVRFEDIQNLERHSQAARQCHGVSDSSAVLLDLPFAELDPGLDPDAGQAESARCLHCGQCTGCGDCVEACPGHILVLGEEGPEVVYPDECWHCGCCRLACGTGSVSYRFPLNMLV